VTATEKEQALHFLSQCSVRAATVSTALQAAMKADAADRPELLREAFDMAIRAQASFDQMAARLQEMFDQH